MVALSFLGTGKYQQTSYSYNGNVVQTNLFPFAFYEFTKPDKLFVIMTQKAKETHAEKLKQKCRFEEILIPDGKSETEIWQIFDLITKQIPRNEKVIFDITHGFRSQPIIVIALLLYLRALRNIEIENILYGAYDAKNDNNIAPVFELKSFIDLIDWSNAVHEFVNNGNMKYFNELLSNIHNNSYIKKMDNPSKQLNGAGTDLEVLTDAFATIRLDEIFRHSYKFSKRIEQLTEDLNNNPQAKPFGDLIYKIFEKFKSISEAEGEKFTQKGFEAQKTIINWYLETGKYQKALTLAREYITSKYMIEISKNTQDSLLDKEFRYRAETELGQLMDNLKNNVELNSRQKDYADIWSALSDIRNDVNHAGMRKGAIPSRGIINNTKNIVKEININF